MVLIETGGIIITFIRTLPYTFSQRSFFFNAMHTEWTGGGRGKMYSFNRVLSSFAKAFCESDFLVVVF